MSLLETVSSLIDQEGPMRVRDYVELALYDPNEGYYAKGPAIGARGDFYTAANVSLFPPAIRRFVEAARERLGAGARVVELGGGTGALSASLGVETIVVEPSPGLAEAQRARGLHVVAALEELAPAPTVFLANEVLDALPVHRLLATEDGLREGYLVVEDGRLREVPGPVSTQALADAVKDYAPYLKPGASVEVNLDAHALLERMARVAPDAYALFLDYGGSTDELYGDGRNDGTLRGFHRHRATGPYENPGAQDVTADVDFTFLQPQAERAGFATAGYRPQGLFLGDLGAAEDMMQALQAGDVEAYMAAKNLLMPTGMGERFKALLLARGGAPVEPPLPGFRAGPAGAQV